MEDRLIAVRLMSPHDHDFTHERPDGSTYKKMVRKGREDKIEEIINYQGPLFAKHPDIDLSPVPPLDKYGQTQSWDEYNEQLRCNNSRSKDST